MWTGLGERGGACRSLAASAFQAFRANGKVERKGEQSFCYDVATSCEEVSGPNGKWPGKKYEDLQGGTDGFVWGSFTSRRTRELRRLKGGGSCMFSWLWSLEAVTFAPWKKVWSLKVLGCFRHLVAECKVQWCKIRAAVVGPIKLLFFGPAARIASFSLEAFWTMQHAE